MPYFFLARRNFATQDFSPLQIGSIDENRKSSAFRKFPGFRPLCLSCSHLGQGGILVALIGVYLTSRINYLLFHSLVELFSIVVAFSLFIITWNSRRFIRNSYLLFLGIAYLFIGGLDLLHALSYKGMGIFTDYDYYANQLWIGARYMESLTLLIAFYFLERKKQPNISLLFLVYAALSTLLIMSVFVWKIFPICFVAGTGLTPFKKISEYIICLILLSSLGLLHINRAKFELSTYYLLFWSIICTIVSELAFTFYINNYGFSNLVGHYFKLFSFMLVYQAIIKNGIVNPFNLIFKELNDTNLQLEKALAEVKTLSGLLPICASCKKIRDDRGYWSNIETYIHLHSDAQFSHGICPDCAARLYPDIPLYKDKMPDTSD